MDTKIEEVLCECGHKHGYHYRREWITVNKQSENRIYVPCQGGGNGDCGCQCYRPVKTIEANEEQA